jgi:hypothetical protein
MPSAELYRRHAATCRRLARAHSDKEWTGSLVNLAYEYEAKAAEMDVSSPPTSPDDTPNGGSSSEYVQG